MKPAVTARPSPDDYLFGIRPIDTPGFVLALLVGAAAASMFFAYGLVRPSLVSRDAGVPRFNACCFIMTKKTSVGVFHLSLRELHLLSGDTRRKLRTEPFLGAAVYPLSSHVAGTVQPFLPMLTRWRGVRFQAFVVEENGPARGPFMERYLIQMRQL
jgi:hypothetical protein